VKTKKWSLWLQPNTYVFKKLHMFQFENNESINVKKLLATITCLFITHICNIFPHNWFIIELLGTFDLERREGTTSYNTPRSNISNNKKTNLILWHFSKIIPIVNNHFMSLLLKLCTITLVKPNLTLNWNQNLNRFDFKIQHHMFQIQ